MTPFSVVEHLDVINYVSFGFFPGPVICEKYTLSQQATEKALSYRVIPAVILHWLLQHEHPACQDCQILQTVLVG